MPDYSASDSYQVNLVLKSKIEDPAFHLFVTKEQDKRSEKEKLSVFHLLALYNIKNNEVDNLDNEIVQKLLTEGLVEKEGNRYKLCSTYYELESYTRQFENQDNPTSTRQVPDKYPTSTRQVLSLIEIIGNNIYSLKELIELIGLKDRENFLNNYLNPSIANDYVEPLYPESPKHPKQKYRLTEKGKVLLNGDKGKL